MMKIQYLFMGAAVSAVLMCGACQTKAQAAVVKKIKQTEGKKNSVSVSWKKVSGADYYVCSLSDGLNETVSEEITEKTYTFSKLKAGSSYFLVVSAYKDGEKIATSEAPFEVVTCPKVSKYKVVQTNAKKTSVTLEASGAKGANYYFVKKTGDEEETVAEGDAEKIKLTGLSLDKTYTYRVYAARTSESGFKAYTAKGYKQVTAKTLGDAVSEDRFEITDMDFLENKYTFGLKDSFKSSDGYELQIRTMDGEERKLVSQDGWDDIEVEDCIKGYFSKYRVRTFVNCNGKKAYAKWSDDKYIGVANDAHGIIKRVGDKKSITLTWQKVQGAKSYEISVSTAGKSTGYKTIKTVSASSKRKLVLTSIGGYSIQLKKNYYFRIRPVAMDGNKEIKSDFTNDLSLRLDS